MSETTTTEIEIPETLHFETEEAPPPVQDRPLTAREQTMQNAVKRAHERMEGELAQSSIYDTEAKALGLVYPDEDPEITAEPPEPEPAPLVAEPVVVIPVAAPVIQQQPQVRNVVVDGRQYEVTEQQYSELARMGMIANTALHQYQQQPAAPQAAPEPPRPLVDPEHVKRVIREIQFGDPDAAAAALTDYTTGLLTNLPQAPQLDPRAIEQRAVAEVRAQLLLDQHKATIQQEYADIFADPQRTFLARHNVDAIRARNVQMGRAQNDLEIYREAGNMVRQAMGTQPPQSAAPEPEPTPVVTAAPRSEVIERKRAAPRPTQNIDRRAPAPQAARAPTGSEIVNQMRQQRHQGPLN